MVQRPLEERHSSKPLKESWDPDQTIGCPGGQGRERTRGGGEGEVQGRSEEAGREKKKRR